MDGGTQLGKVISALSCLSDATRPVLSDFFDWGGGKGKPSAFSLPTSVIGRWNKHTVGRVVRDAKNDLKSGKDNCGHPSFFFTKAADQPRLTRLHPVSADQTYKGILEDNTGVIFFRPDTIKRGTKSPLRLSHCKLSLSLTVARICQQHFLFGFVSLQRFRTDNCQFKSQR